MLWLARSQEACGVNVLDTLRRDLPQHLAALQLLVNLCASPEGKKDLIVTAGACEAITPDEACLMISANMLETA